MLRKFYHISGLVFPLIIYCYSREAAIYAAGSIFIAILLIDLCRLRMPALNRGLFDKFPTLFKKEEFGRVSGSPYFLGGVLCSLLFFSPGAASGGIILLSVGDMSASLAGERIGRHSVFGKTLEGSLSFFITGTAALFIFNSAVGAGLTVVSILTATAVCSVIELLPIGVNDNLLIPPVGSLLLALFL